MKIEEQSLTYKLHIYECIFSTNRGREIIGINVLAYDYNHAKLESLNEFKRMAEQNEGWINKDSANPEVRYHVVTTDAPFMVKITKQEKL